MTQASPLILLLGMHRSGTSLLGSLLPALGVPLPGPLIAGDQHNPEGYYERHDVTALQEQLLINLQRWWPGSQGVLPLPDGWLESDSALRVRANLRALLIDESRRQVGPWAIKDPRTSLLLPLWLGLTGELGLPVRLVLSVREPCEVVHSLLRRDQQAAGMTVQRAQALWWRHYRQVLLDGISCPLLVVHYSHWFDPASSRQQLARLRAFIRPDRNGGGEAELSAALTLIKPEHRHSLSAAPEPAELPERVRWLNSELLALSASDPSIQHLARLSSRLQPEAMASSEGSVARFQHLRQRVKRLLNRAR